MSDTATAEAGAETAATETAQPTSIEAIFGGGEAAPPAGPTDAESLAAFMRGEGDPADVAADANPLLDLFKDPDAKTYTEKKGWKSIDDIVKSAAHLEKLARGEVTGKLVLPTGPEDAEGYERAFAALGRPESPEGYKFSELQGVDPDFSQNAASWLFEAGVGTERASALAEKWNAYMSERATAEATAAQQQTEADLAGLQSEWGVQAKQNFEMARRGASTFGLTPEEMGQISQAIGTQRAMKIMAGIGKTLGEDSFVDGEGKSAFGMTADQANARLETLRRDQAWQARWMAGGADEKAEWSRLTRIIGQQAA